MSNGVNVLANALQSYLARKHSAGMLEAQQAQQSQRDATANEWQNREWQRSAMHRDEDMARALEQQAWSRNWQQQQAAARAAERQQDMGVDAARDEARMALDRERLAAEKEWRSQQIQAQKDIAKGHDATRKETAPRPGAGRGTPRTGTARKDDTPYKVWKARLDAMVGELRSLGPNLMIPDVKARADKLRADIATHAAQEPEKQPGDEEPSQVQPPPAGAASPPQAAPPRGRAGDY